jgi:hypothetical protein
VVLCALYFSQGCRPGLGLCRAYGAVVCGMADVARIVDDGVFWAAMQFQIENFKFEMKRTGG